MLIFTFTACAVTPAVSPTSDTIEIQTEETQGTTKDLSQEWSRAYEGTTLNIIAEATLNTTILKTLIPEFTEKTGIEINLEEAPYDNLVQKVVLDFSTHKGGYDLISMPYEYLGSFAENGYIIEVGDKLTKESEFDPANLLPALWDASTNWKGKIYGMPSNSAVMMMFYRSDLMENEIEKKAFEEKYGYPLAPAQTWAQYRDIAEFFTRNAGDQLAGNTLEQNFYGVSLAGKRHIATVCEWFNYAWTFGGGLFDKDGQLVINSQENIDSLVYWKGLTEFAPPGFTSATWDEVTAALQQGTAAQAITWGDTAGAMEDQKQSKVFGKIGYASIPTIKEGDPKVAHLGSWIYAINKDSINQDASLLFMKWALSAPVQLELSKAGGLPATISAFEDASLQKTLPYWNQTLISLQESRNRPRIPQWGQLSDVLSLELSRVMAGEIDPAEALNQAQISLLEALKDALPVTSQ